jgi:hypothetical protein
MTTPESFRVVNKMRGPIVAELTRTIEQMDGVSQVDCHDYLGEQCCSAKVDTNKPGEPPMLTSAYGYNRMLALTRLLIRINQLRSGT